MILVTDTLAPRSRSTATLNPKMSPPHPRWTDSCKMPLKSSTLITTSCPCSTTRACRSSPPSRLNSPTSTGCFVRIPDPPTRTGSLCTPPRLTERSTTRFLPAASHRRQSMSVSATPGLTGLCTMKGTTAWFGLSSCRIFARTKPSPTSKPWTSSTPRPRPVLCPPTLSSNLVCRPTSPATTRPTASPTTSTLTRRCERESG
mmetsp:Transcript_46405/g.109252  ORF Transcript_46405/g.109252 Transcript_46405/m.109252 type:complete len:202 (-) Transcript_46405:635-1240(-)